VRLCAANELLLGNDRGETQRARFVVGLFIAALIRLVASFSRQTHTVVTVADSLFCQTKNSVPFWNLSESRANHCASKMPNNFAQFTPCSLLIAFPWEGQEIECKMQSN
jgi:hypothetical protein